MGESFLVIIGVRGVEIPAGDQSVELFPQALLASMRHRAVRLLCVPGQLGEQPEHPAGYLAILGVGSRVQQLEDYVDIENGYGGAKKAALEIQVAAHGEQYA